MGWVRDALNMSGKVAVVTGAGQGIGRAVATGLADAGAQVVIGEIAEETGKDTEQTIIAAGGRALFVQTDVRQGDSIRALVKAARDRFGRLDIMVNNAGGNFQMAALDFSDNGFDAIVRMNFKSMFIGSQAAAKAMIEEGHGGAIVSTASVAGIRGTGFGVAPYSGAKAAIIGITRSLAAEWAPHGIRVNAVAPGGVNTAGRTRNMQEDPARRTAANIPLGRLAEPEQIAAAHIFLASDLAAHVTGQVIAVDGGSSSTSPAGS